MMINRSKLRWFALLLSISILCGGCNANANDSFIGSDDSQRIEQLDIARLAGELIAFCYQSGVQDDFGSFRTDIVIANGLDTSVISRQDLSPGNTASLGCFSFRRMIWTGDYAMDWGNSSGDLALASGHDTVITDLMFVQASDGAEEIYSLQLDRRPSNLSFVDPTYINGQSAQNRYLIIANNALGNRYQNVWLYYPDRNGRAIQVTDHTNLSLSYASVSLSPNEAHLIVYGSAEFPGFEIYNIVDDTSIELEKRFHFIEQPTLSDWPFSGFFASGPVEVKEILKDGSVPVWLNEEQVIFLAPTKESELIPFVYDLSSDSFSELSSELSGINGLIASNPSRTQLAFIHYASWRQINKVAIVIYELSTRKFRTVMTLTSDENTDLYVTNVDWSSDGEYIVFSSNHTGQSEIYVVRADGTAWTCLTKHLDGDAIYPIWRK